MLGSSWLDPVLGIDVHFEMVPTPAPVPTPIPNPFIGIVFDPIGLAAGIALGAAIGAVVGAPFTGPVLYWTAFPATNTGTEAKGVPGHIIIPPGVAWAPFPKTPKPVVHPGETPKPALPIKPEDDAVVVFGSKIVSVMGSNAVRIGDIAMSCSEPLRLPSSVVLAIPKGAPILIGGPPSLDLMAAILASLRTRFVSDSLHALISRMKPSRFRNFLHRAACFLTGHPVDVASGKVLTESIDAELPGPLPLKIERIYSSAFAKRDGVLGHGWSSSIDQSIWRERGKVVLQAEDGREIEFDTFDLPHHRIEPGQRVENRIERLDLHCEEAGVWRVVDHLGVNRVFAPVGRADGRAMIQRIRSACGCHEIRFGYDTNGNVAQIRDSGGRIVELRCDARGRIVELRLPAPLGEGYDVHRRYAYDDAGDLAAVTDALGGHWRYAYVTHLLTQETDRRGLSFYFAYDGIGEDAWCVRTWGDGGIYDHVLSYDKKKHLTCVTNSLGHTTVYRMNVVGQVVEILDAFGTKTRYDYDPHTLEQLREVDGLGRATTYTYDARGNVTRIDRPDGSVVELEYDDRNALVHGRDPGGTDWTWRYDSLGRLNERRSADGGRTHYRYEGGYLTSVIDPAGGVTSVGYDAHGMLDALRTPDGAVTQWSYDALGRAVRIADAQGNAQVRSFDLLGRVIEVGEADGNVRRLEYDPEGALVRLTDANQQIEYAYVGMGRVHSRTQAGTTVTFEYDSEEQLRAIRNQHALAYSFTYDQRGELTSELGFDGRRREYKRDAEGQIISVARASGLETRYRYDAGGRIVEIDHGKGEIESFEFRRDGLLVAAKNAVARLRLERDNLGRIVREWQNHHWIESYYDAYGRRIGLRSSLGAVHEIERNQMGDVVALRHRDLALSDGDESSWARPDWEARFVRDATGQELERSLPGGVRARWSRDKLGRPLRQQLWSNDAVHRDVHYEWSPDDRLRGLFDGVQGLQVSYGHDALGRLSWTKYGDDEAIGDLRLPDAVGNLFRSAARDDREYGPAGQLLAVHTPTGTRRYTYDLEGNLVERREPSGEVWRYEWSASGRLRAVERPDGKLVEFEYDPIGRRLSKRFDGNITRFVWDGHRPLHEWIEAEAPPARPVGDLPPSEPARAKQDALDRLLTNRPSRGPPDPDADDSIADSIYAPTLERAPANLITWLFEPDSHIPVAKLLGHERLSIVCDYLGVPVAMFDAAGRKVWAAELDSRGAVRERPSELQAADPHACPFRWPGQYEDAETGLYYNRFRYYDPEAGQYTSQDPLGLRAGLAAYAYVDDPLTACDVFGLIVGPPYDFATLLHEAKTNLNFKTNPNGAVFWSGPRMADAQAWALANGKTTLEQTHGGQFLDSLKLFDSSSGLTGQQAAEIWDAASLRFAQEATGEVSVFSTGAKRMNNWGNLRTWWRVEKPALDINPKVTNIVRRRKDGTPCA